MPEINVINIDLDFATVNAMLQWMARVIKIEGVTLADIGVGILVIFMAIYVIGEVFEAFRRNSSRR